MILSRGSNYAFHALARLALLPPEGLASVDQLAQPLGASPSYMAKLLQRLARARLVVAKRGSRGGYSLAQPAEVITLWDVVAALSDGVEWEALSIAPCSTCPLASTCPLEGALRAAWERVSMDLQRVTVGKLISLLRFHEEGRPS
jgi:Rrf2 family protein